MVVTFAFQVLTRRVKAGSVPPTVDDSGTMDGNRFTGEDSAPIGIDMDVRWQSLILLTPTYWGFTDTTFTTSLAPFKAESRDSRTGVPLTNYQ